MTAIPGSLRVPAAQHWQWLCVFAWIRPSAQKTKRFVAPIVIRIVRTIC